MLSKLNIYSMYSFIGLLEMDNLYEVNSDDSTNCEVEEFWCFSWN